jgi:hypothetical protein
MSAPHFKLDPAGPAPETREPHFLLLLFGAAAAPIAWLGQTMLSYGVTAYGCYPGDHPAIAIGRVTLSATVLAFDIAALLVAATGFAVAWRSWKTVTAHAGRNRFLAQWGIFSSLCFMLGIVFNILASILVSPC